MSNANFAHFGSLAGYKVVAVPRSGILLRKTASSLRKFANFASNQVRNSQNKLLVISGPTATGKTKLAFKLAEKFNGELISADSRQVYRGMDIVTGKEWESESNEQRTENNVQIWGYDVVEPNQEWSASHFVKFAKKVIADVHQRGKLPIVVGGTGLYISNLLNPPETLNIPPDKKLRIELEKLSVKELQNRLKEINPERFALMNESDQQNPRRLVRAIEVSSIIPAKAGIYLNRFPIRSGMTNVLHIALTAPIKEIDRRIEERVRQRIEKGAEAEVKGLVEKYGWDSALSFTIGYKEWRPRNDLGGQCPKEEIIKNWTMHEKQYARRQLTWMAKYSPDKLFNISQPDYIPDIEAYVSRWYYGKE